jgi:hypothetical protein
MKRVAAIGAPVVSNDRILQSCQEIKSLINNLVGLNFDIVE